MVSKKSRIIRVVLGVLFLGLMWYFVNPWIALLGLIPIVVGATGFCPACYFLNRCSIRKN